MFTTAGMSYTTAIFILNCYTWINCAMVLVTAFWLYKLCKLTGHRYPTSFLLPLLGCLIPPLGVVIGMIWTMWYIKELHRCMPSEWWDISETAGTRYNPEVQNAMGENVACQNSTLKDLNQRLIQPERPWPKR